VDRLGAKDLLALTSFHGSGLQIFQLDYEFFFLGFCL
jgi:hypothetical protein